MSFNEEVNEDTTDGETSEDESPEYATADIESLYTEILYEYLHKLGTDDKEYLQEEVFNSLKESFHINEQRHELLLNSVRARKAPDVFLRVKVIAAKDLKPKETNGLNDPSCKIFLNSSSNEWCNTSVKRETLAPIWEEEFSLPISTIDDTLNIEIYSETDYKKRRKVKGFKGTKVFLKDRCSCKHQAHKFIGLTTISLNSIPYCGCMTWSDLTKRRPKKKQKDKKNKTRDIKKNKSQKVKKHLRGMVHINLSLFTGKDMSVAWKEYRELVRTLLYHEMRTIEETDGPWAWDGEFNEVLQHVMAHHVAQCNIDAAHEALACWIEFCQAHESRHPLNFQLFERLLSEKLVSVLQNSELFNDKEVKLFWETTKENLLPSCMTYIQELPMLSETKSTVELLAVLRILAFLDSIRSHTNVDVFSKFISTISIENNDKVSNTYGARQAVLDTVLMGTQLWVDNTVVEQGKNSSDTNDEQCKLFQLLICTVRALRQQMQKTAKQYNVIFQDVLQFPYAKFVYDIVYDKVYDLAKPSAVETSEMLQLVNFETKQTNKSNSNERNLALATAHYEFYIVFKHFVALGKELDPYGSLQWDEFYEWFRNAVNNWLDLAQYKAIQHIQNAVKLDSIMPQDEYIKCSTSAIDALFTFEKISFFWVQLDWPDMESRYCFMIKIINDIYQCVIFFADEMSRRVDELSKIDKMCKTHLVTLEWCTMINNMEHMCDHMKSFLQTLVRDKLKTESSNAQEITDVANNNVQMYCDNLYLIINECVASVTNKTTELIRKAADKMSVSLEKLLKDNSNDRESSERLIYFMNSCIPLMRAHLREEKCDRKLHLVWQKMIQTTVPSIIHTDIQARKNPSNFRHLLKKLYILERYFPPIENMQQQTDETDTVDKDYAQLFEKTEAYLKLLGMETSELIHLYHMNRFAEQEQVTPPPKDHMQLTARIVFVKNTLHVNIMNTRNIKPGGNRDTRDMYVVVNFRPREMFHGVMKCKTKTYPNDLCPLFDDEFSVHISKEQQNNKDSLLHLLLKDCKVGALRGKEVVGETFLNFSSIPRSKKISSLENVPQKHLPLTRPSNSNAYEALEILKLRSKEDPLAKQFLKKENDKMK